MSKLQLMEEVSLTIDSVNKSSEENIIDNLMLKWINL